MGVTQHGRTYRLDLADPTLREWECMVLAADPEQGIVLGLAFGLLGVGMTLVYGLGGVLNLAYGQMVVLAAIVVYDLYHKPWPGSVFIMGSCRTLLYLAAASAVTGALGLSSHAEVIVKAVALGGFVVGVSLAARSESAASPTHPAMSATGLRSSQQVSSRFTSP